MASPGTLRERLPLSNSERSYAWQCFACDASNPPRADLCAACGFPARATGKQIGAARASKATAARPGIVPADRSAIDSLIAALSPLPMWRKVLVVLGGSLCVGGAFWLKVTMSLAGVAWGLGALALGMLVAGLSQVSRSTTPSSSAPDSVGP